MFWWITMVSYVDNNEDDVKVDFLHPHGPDMSFYWPTLKNSCFVPIKSNCVQFLRQTLLMDCVGAQRIMFLDRFLV